MPAAQARELKEQIIAHLDDALVTSSAFPASQIIRLYTENVITAANTFSASVGAGLQDDVATLGALLRAENEMSVQRAILYAALSAQPAVLTPENLYSLQQAAAQEATDLTAFNSSADMSEQQLFTHTVAGAVVDHAAAQETLAVHEAEVSTSAPLTGNTGLDAATWYGDMSTTIGDTRQVADQLAGQITGQADTLKSNAARSLLLTSITLGLILVLLISAVPAGWLGHILARASAPPSQ